MNFSELNIISPILNAIKDAGYEEPTEIQQKSIPIVLAGEDIIGCAQTGTGKTASFAIPILQNLTNKASNSKKIRTLILTPTRELAVQINDNFKLYGKNLPLKHLAIFGGVNQKPQISTIKNGVDILIATPGRLLDLIAQGHIKLNQIEILVLDEADRMLDMGFVNDIKKVLKFVPEDRQTLFFSATMPKPIRKFSHTVLRRPKEVNVTPVSSTAETVEQFVYHVDKENKVELLIQLLKENPNDRTLIFTRTKHGANRLARNLEKVGIPAAAIHGDKSQNARQRALNEFKEEKLKVLIATDIAARGIDIDMLPFVINFELPNVPETYVHRIGRTGRAGREGKAISFCAPDEKGDLMNIEKLIGTYVHILKTPKMEKKASTSSASNHSKPNNPTDKKKFFKKKNDRGRRR
ncbi:DEAD/DEAH box helicase [Chishuiella sp.]|uniref:DEAD/DEAH box helicase n=1 Tax=Chishuiella sp. TaxID=1969467 RepID=UPI0028AD20F1|nr:DEAD/DEAH box helicase [Chishuiella sp.]